MIICIHVYIYIYTYIRIGGTRRDATPRSQIQQIWWGGVKGLSLQ